MSTLAYLRFSTDKQDERQQLNTITKYAEAKGMRIDKTYSDEGVSGGVSYTKRNLFELCNDIQQGDIVIISEISRLTRSGIGELSEIIEKYFKPNKLRLIICNVNLDIDCSDMNPMIEMQLMMLSTFAKIEKQLIQDRTKSAIEARKKQIETQGFFINKRGEKVTDYSAQYGIKTGKNRADVMREAQKARVANQKEEARNNPNNKNFLQALKLFESRNGYLGANTDISAFVQELNTLGFKTATGLEFTKPRALAMLKKVRELYGYYYAS